MSSPWSWERDEQYLFRLTSTFGWDDAISLCASLVDGTEAAASRRDDADDDADDDEYAGYFNDFLGHQGRHGHSLQQWLQLAQRLLFYKDQWGNSPMHAASYVKPPVAVIEALFRLGRSLWKHGNYQTGATPPVWATPCKDASTPLLVACSTGASTAVLNCYLDEIEYYIWKGWAPESARMLVIQPDSQGATPLMGLMSFHSGWIKRRLEQGVSRLNAEDLSSHHFLPRRSGEQAVQSLPDYWDLANRMLRFATMHIRPHSPSSTPVLIHRCAAIAHHCPVALLEWVVDPHASSGDDKGWVPADLSCSTPDSTGKLSLHRAMEAVDASRAFLEDAARAGADGDIDDSNSSSAHAKTGTTPKAEAIYSNPLQERNRVQIVSKLLQWHAAAATIPFGNGRSPLIQAIAHGGTWHPMGCRNSESESPGMLQLLWGYAPEQASEIDPVTGLYPFMLAATVSPGHDDNERHDRDRNVVDTVYNLLRKDPQLISGALV